MRGENGYVRFKGGLGAFQQQSGVTVLNPEPRHRGWLVEFGRNNKVDQICTSAINTHIHSRFTDMFFLRLSVDEDTRDAMARHRYRAGTPAALRCRRTQHSEGSRRARKVQEL